MGYYSGQWGMICYHAYPKGAYVAFEERSIQTRSIYKDNLIHQHRVENMPRRITVG